MQKSESIGKLAEALSKAQGVIRGAIKDSNNPFFKSTYADLSSVWDACREPLAKNGLSVTQLTDVTEKGIAIETILMHSSGEWISGRLDMPLSKQDPQGVGSAITYARRYTLAAIVGVAPEDDDAESTADRTKKNAQAQGKPPGASSAPKTDNYKFLSTLTAEKKRVGEHSYYVVLGQHGFEHSNQITDRDTQKKVYEALKQITDMEVA